MAQGSESIGRSIGSAVLGVLAILLMPLSLLAFWASTTLTQTDEFVAEMAPVVQTPQVQEALADGIVSGVLGAIQLQPAVEKALEPAIRTKATRIAASPQVAQAWKTGIRGAHTQFLAVMKGQAATDLDRQGRVTVVLKIPVPGLSSALQQAGAGNAADALTPTVSIPLMTASQLDTAQRLYRVSDAWGPWAPVIVAVLALLAILLARRWRTATTLIAIGWLGMSVALTLFLMVAREPLVRHVTPPVARTVADAAYGLAARGLYGEIGLAVAVSVVMLVVVVASLVFRRRRTV
ncbi:hypothetical protein ACWEOW_21860 [Monashia sp. NPDC004114]